jgi:uncharacterized protein (DUF169 family)
MMNLNEKMECMESMESMGEDEMSESGKQKEFATHNLELNVNFFGAGREIEDLQ